MPRVSARRARPVPGPLPVLRLRVDGRTFGFLVLQMIGISVSCPPFSQTTCILFVVATMKAWLEPAACFVVTSNAHVQILVVQMSRWSAPVRGHVQFQGMTSVALTASLNYVYTLCVERLSLSLASHGLHKTAACPLSTTPLDALQLLYTRFSTLKSSLFSLPATLPPVNYTRPHTAVWSSPCSTALSLFS